MIERLKNVWVSFEAVGSPELKTTLETERSRFHNFEDFAGQTFSDWGELLAIGTPEKPFITLSSPRQSNEGFSAEVNRTEGLDFVLERTSPVFPFVWAESTNVLKRSFEHRIELTETNTSQASYLYRLRAK